jgi:hypothetical protein
MGFTPPTRMSGVAKAVNQKVDQAISGMWAVGQVTVVSPLTVTVNGASLVLPKLATYSPAVNDVVQIAWPPGRPFVLGKIG